MERTTAVTPTHDGSSIHGEWPGLVDGTGLNPLGIGSARPHRCDHCELVSSLVGWSATSEAKQPNKLNTRVD